MPKTPEPRAVRLHKVTFPCLALSLLLTLSAGCRASNWLSRLPDEFPVALVSIPGSHDSATGDGFPSGFHNLIGSICARCQDLSLAEQWSVGVRAFDLRPSTRDGYLQINHGTVSTNLRFADALLLLRDSLIANPSEFAVVHMRHEVEGDKVDGTYEQLLLEVLQSDSLCGYFSDFRRDLTVGELRGKILLLSRDVYAASPVGAFIRNWCSAIDWGAQTAGILTGSSSSVNATAPLYVQDYYDTHTDGAIDRKIAAISAMLDFSTSQVAVADTRPCWIFNFASAYSKTLRLFGHTIALSNGYRDNAARTGSAILEYLRTHEAGPTGIVMIDYAGTDMSNGYATRGRELVDSIIANNFNYLARIRRQNPARNAPSMHP